MKKPTTMDFVDRLYNENSEDLRKYLLKRSSAAEMADEAVQETFFEACRHADDLTCHPCPRGWLFKTASFKLEELQRFYGRSPSQSLEDSAASVENGLLLSDLEFRITVRNFLTPQDYHMLMLRFTAMCSYKDIGRIYGMKADTCKKRIYRMLERLKSEFDKN